MARFDVYLNSGKSVKSVPFLMDIQSELLDHLNRRVVVPMYHLEKFRDIKLPKDLAPVFKIDGLECVMQTIEIGSVPANILRKPVANLGRKQHIITAAMDRLFNGF
jgi:toxin CcdB